MQLAKNAIDAGKIGLPVLGIDQSAAMLAIGRARYPEVSFALGSLTSLGLADDSCRGVLSRSSIIHLPPGLLASAVAEFARVLGPGGWLLLSFSATDGPEPPYEHYDHRVTGAYRWWPDHVVALLHAAGITETTRLIENPEPDDLRQFRVAFILARKSAGVRTAAAAGESHAEQHDEHAGDDLDGDVIAQDGDAEDDGDEREQVGDGRGGGAFVGDEPVVQHVGEAGGEDAQDGQGG